jgi:hypothetical protein
MNGYRLSIITNVSQQLGGSMITRKATLILMALVLLLPLAAYGADVSLTSDGKVPGQPFKVLQDQVDQLKLELENIQYNNAISAAVHGTVWYDGSILHGTGFSVSHEENTGLYTITFDTPFSETPDCIAQANISGVDWALKCISTLFPYSTPTSTIYVQCSVASLTNAYAYPDPVFDVQNPISELYDTAFTFICVQ